MLRKMMVMGAVLAACSAYGQTENEWNAVKDEVLEHVRSGHSVTSGGFSGGLEAEALGYDDNTGGGAIGYSAKTGTGGAVGRRATAESGGGAVGDGAKSINGAAMGRNAQAEAGVALGDSTTTSSGVAIGNSAKTIKDGAPIDAVQIGYGENSVAGSLQVYSFPFMSPEGFVPVERLQNITSNQIDAATDMAYRGPAAERLSCADLTFIPGAAGKSAGTDAVVSSVVPGVGLLFGRGIVKSDAGLAKGEYNFYYHPAKAGANENTLHFFANSTDAANAKFEVRLYDASGEIYASGEQVAQAADKPQSLTCTYTTSDPVIMGRLIGYSQSGSAVYFMRWEP